MDKKTRWSRLLAAMLALCALAAPAHAMRFLVQENRIFAAGAMEEGDASQLRLLLSTHKTSGELVLVNVTGWALAEGLAMGKLVADGGLNTTVAGYCMGSCAPVFVAGKERRFTAGEHPRRTFVAIQGGYASAGGPADPKLNAQWLAFLKQRLGPRYDEAAMRQAVEQGTDGGGYLRIRETGRTAAADRQPFFCASAQTLAQDCAVLTGKDAVSLGIVTVAETASVVIPGSFLPAPEFFGKALGAPTPDFNTVLRAQGVAMCGSNAACLQRWEAALPVYARQKPNRATALGVGKPGLAFSDDLETPDLAAKRAIFLCNHVAGNKKLCRAAAVNDTDLGDEYAQSESQAKAALATLKTPAAPAWADEDADKGVAAPTGYRMRELQSATPLAVGGVRTWKTGELADALKANAPVLVDVAAASDGMLPAAVHFWEGGLAFADAAVEAAFDQRFRDMLEVIAPAKDRAVVFYCKDAECWGAANAAMRAQKAGYANAGWYRGGVASWTKAGLPLVRKVPMAVIN